MSHGEQPRFQPSVSPIWVQERVKTFLASDAEVPYIFIFENVVANLNAEPDSGLIKSADTLSTIFKMRLELQKIDYRPSNTILNKSLRVHTAKGSFTVIPYLVFEPLLSPEARNTFNDKLEYFIRGFDKQPVTFGLNSITRQWLDTDDIILNHKPATPFSYRRYDWNIQDCVKGNTLVVKVPIKFCWGPFVHRHAVAMCHSRMATEPTLLGNDDVVVSCIADDDTKKRKEFICSARLLVAASSVFRNMFETYDVKEKRERRVLVDDVGSDTMRVLIGYLQAGPESVLAEGSWGLCQLARAADKYGILDLLLLCNRMMVNTISADTALDYYELSNRIGLHDLKMQCLKSLKREPWAKTVAFGEFWVGVLKNPSPTQKTAPTALDDMLDFFRDTNM